MLFHLVPYHVLHRLEGLQSLKMKLGSDHFLPHLIISSETWKDEADPRHDHCSRKELGDKSEVHQVENPLQLLVLPLEGVPSHHVPEHIEDGHGEGEHLHLHLLVVVGQDVLNQVACLPLDHHLEVILAKAEVAEMLHSKVPLTGPPLSFGSRLAIST